MPRWLKILSEISCPNCDHKEVEKMPRYATKTSFECRVCRTVIKPLPSSCCIYCSYGSVVCPKQQSRLRTLNLQMSDEEDDDGEILA